MIGTTALAAGGGGGYLFGRGGRSESENGAESEDGTDEEPEFEDEVGAEPSAVVEEYFTALAAGGGSTMRELLHPESPALEHVETVDATELTVLETQTLEENSEHTVVDYTLSVPDESTTLDEDGRLLLVRIDGEWLLWDPASPS